MVDGFAHGNFMGGSVPMDTLSASAPVMVNGLERTGSNVTTTSLSEI